MKILIVSSSYPRWENDSRGPSIIQQAKCLQGLGAQVLVLTPHGPGMKEREILDGVDVIRFRYIMPERLEILMNFGGGLPSIWQKKPLARLIFIPFFLSYVFAVVRYGWDADIIHAHWTLPAFAAWLGCLVQKRPIVVTIHGSDIYELRNHMWGRLINRLVFSGVNKVIAVSKALADAAIAQGLSPGKVEVIPDGINLEKFIPSGKIHEKFILFCGSLIPRKGVNFLLEAMVQIFKEFPGFRLVIIGVGPEEDNLKEQAESLGVAPKIDFVGSQSQDQVKDWMRRAWLFVLPSLDEALGIVLLEAQSCGTPCIASNVGGIPEFISPQAGILVPPADPKALELAIESLLSDYERWEAFSTKASEWARQNFFTWDMVAEKLLVVFQSIVITPL